MNEPEQQLDSPEGYEWTDADIQRAIEKLEYEIKFNGKIWDEDGDYLRDLGIEVCRILRHDGIVEQLALIRDAFAERAYDYAVWKVTIDPDKYCEREDGGVRYE